MFEVHFLTSKWRKWMKDAGWSFGVGARWAPFGSSSIIVRNAACRADNVDHVILVYDDGRVTELVEKEAAVCGKPDDLRPNLTCHGKGGRDVGCRRQYPASMFPNYPPERGRCPDCGGEVYL